MLGEGHWHTGPGVAVWGPGVHAPPRDCRVVEGSDTGGMSSPTRWCTRVTDSQLTCVAAPSTRPGQVTGGACRLTTDSGGSCVAVGAPRSPRTSTTAITEPRGSNGRRPTRQRVCGVVGIATKVSTR